MDVGDDAIDSPSSPACGDYERQQVQQWFPDGLCTRRNTERRGSSLSDIRLSNGALAPVVGVDSLADLSRPRFLDLGPRGAFAEFQNAISQCEFLIIRQFASCFNKPVDRILTHIIRLTYLCVEHDVTPARAFGSSRSRELFVAVFTIDASDLVLTQSRKRGLPPNLSSAHTDPRHHQRRKPRHQLVGFR